jgi:hypothetical protein
MQRGMDIKPFNFSVFFHFSLALKTSMGKMVMGRREN